ncbi:Hypothetical predicted protein [Cloeon dipterum]|uniref:Uncharacterized protein n=1 Tax=Cloeon dipterum TaxID=197152 RepID=A0A8S1C9W8_9INSE|nr:Hypothetical predicted protein [Cloeon dipterum]
MGRSRRANVVSQCCPSLLTPQTYEFRRPCFALLSKIVSALAVDAGAAASPAAGNVRLFRTVHPNSGHGRVNATGSLSHSGDVT